MTEIPCENCSEILDSDKRNPMVLPCGHTICKTCLADIWRRLAYIKCPIDAKKHFSKLEDFPTNFLVQKLINNDIKVSGKSSDDTKMPNRSQTLTNSSVKKIGSLVQKDTTKKPLDKSKTTVTKSTSEDQDEKPELKSQRVHSINIIYNSKYNLLKRNLDSPLKKKITSTSSIPLSPSKDMENLSISEGTPVKEVNKMDENILFTYVRVMKNISITFDKKSSYECEYIITEEVPEGEKKFDIKAWFNKGFYTIIRITLLLVLLYLNLLFMKIEMFLEVYIFITLINNTRRSIISQDLKQMSTCLKRW